MTRSSILLSDLRVRVTAASVDYVGSITIHEEMCVALGLHERQLVQIRNQETGVELWTYVIMGHYDEVSPGTVCLNGAAAHLVNVGDVVHISAFGLVLDHHVTTTNMIKPRSWDAVANGFVDIVSKIGKPDANWCSNVLIGYACGKVHRPRITAVKAGNDLHPTLHIDADWAREAGIKHDETTHIVNVTNGQRDIMTAKYLPSSSKSCEIHMGVPYANKVDGYGCRPGYNEGDVLIAMSYCHLTRETILRGEAPSMKISFPFEKPKDHSSTELSEMWDITTQVLWDEKTLAAGLVKTLGLKPGMKVLDCSCGAGFPGIELARAGIDIKMSDGSDDMVALAKKRAKKELGEDRAKELDVRCSFWNDLPNVWGKEVFDVVIWRGNSMPYVCDWNAPAASNSTKSKNGYTRLVQSAKGVYDTLKPGGRLYADCIPASAETGASVLKKGKKPDGTPVHFDWTFTVDDVSRSRNWKSLATVGEGYGTRVYKTNITGLLVRELELKSVMTYAGFGLVEKAECPGEAIYQPFHLFKPAKPMTYYDRQIDRYRRVWNENGKICWGLCDGIWPTTDSDRLSDMAQIQGKGCMVGPNIALQEYMVSKYRDMEVQSILDIGCGTGRSSIDLAKRFPNATVIGCDLGSLNIARGEEMVREENIPNVQFFCGTVQDMVSNMPNPGTFNAAWSEAALCHAPADSRAIAIEAIANHLEEGGIFVINDDIAGNSPVSPAAQLHIYERLRYDNLWNKKEYVDILESNNLQLLEYVDLSSQQSMSYLKLSAEAEDAASEAANEKDKEGQQVYNILSQDYKTSSSAIDREEFGWALFACKKVTKAMPLAVDSSCNGAWRANAGPMTANGFKH